MTRYFMVGETMLVISGLFLLCGCGEEGGVVGDSSAAIKGPVSFNKHVAPLIFQNCSSCHRPGQSAPFSLLTYEDVRKRAQQIVEVTQSGFMPPWLPQPGYGKFLDERRLSPGQIGLLRRWAEEGAVEGDSDDLPPAPKWDDDWFLGKPDLVVTLPETYLLPGEGRDLYRNFVIPDVVDRARFIDAIEFRPGSRAVHHAFINLDITDGSRRLDAEDAEPGFPGIHTPPSAQSPPGHFLSWQPGRTPRRNPAGLAWELAAGTDLVLQVHMQPVGRPEQVRPSIAFYFTDQPPTNQPIKLFLDSLTIEIPAGESNHRVTDSYILPVDVTLLSILPHAHYLAREMEAYAILPDQKRLGLMRIAKWDFNWQGDYQYAAPVFLPRGTTLEMRYSYDNSTNNALNPNDPPQDVRYGLQSSDEMAELWLQVLTSSLVDRQKLEKDRQPRVLHHGIAFNDYLLRLDPRDAKAYVGRGKAMLFLGRHAEAAADLRQAIDLQSDLDEPHYYLGLMFRIERKLTEARKEFEQATRINPNHAKAHGNLGLILLEQGLTAPAETHFREALRIDPQDTIARESLDWISKARSNSNAR